jgi:hypothetical protein
MCERQKNMEGKQISRMKNGWIAAMSFAEMQGGGDGPRTSCHYKEGCVRGGGNAKAGSAMAASWLD